MKKKDYMRRFNCKCHALVQLGIAEHIDRDGVVAINLKKLDTITNEEINNTNQFGVARTKKTRELINNLINTFGI